MTAATTALCPAAGASQGQAGQCLSAPPLKTPPAHKAGRPCSRAWQQRCAVSMGALLLLHWQHHAAAYCQLLATTRCTQCGFAAHAAAGVPLVAAAAAPAAICLEEEWGELPQLLPHCYWCPPCCCYHQLAAPQSGRALRCQSGQQQSLRLPGIVRRSASLRRCRHKQGRATVVRVGVRERGCGRVCSLANTQTCERDGTHTGWWWRCVYVWQWWWRRVCVCG